MAWIESHTTLRTHKKLKMLCNELKINRREGIGLLHCLWWWAIENREDGDLSNLFDRDIANACDWDGDSKKLVKTLQKCGWLVDHRIKDWNDYAGRLLRERIRGRFRRRSTDASMDGTTDASKATKPNQTVPNQTVKDKNGDFFTKEDKKRIEKRLFEVRGTTPESMSTGLALLEFAAIVQDKKPKDPVAYIMGILNNEAATK